MLGVTPVLSVAVLCVTEWGQSDIAEGANDLMGRILGAGHALVGVCTVENHDTAIRGQVQDWLDAGDIDAIITVDKSVFSEGQRPPSIILCDETRSAETYSLVLPDEVFGFVGVVDIRSMRSRQSVPHPFPLESLH